MLDVIIVGGGPAGMNAALYAKRLGLETLIIESLEFGGQMLNTLEIENYVGMKNVSGFDLSSDMEEHMREFLDDSHVIYDEVKSITKTDGTFEVKLQKEVLRSKAVIIATGCQYRKIGISGEGDLLGRGVSYCAVCDGPFFKDKDIAVIGGGNSAVEEALYLSTIARNVTIVHRRDGLRASKVYADKAMAKENIDFKWSHVPTSIDGEEKVSGLSLKSTKDNTEHSIDVDGVFVYIGVDPNLPKLEGMDSVTSESGFIITNEDMSTSVDGLFAIGDIREKELRQIITAAGDGAIAAQSVYNYSLTQ